MKKRKVRILYFVPELSALSSSILHAQVLAPARFLNQNGFECFFIGTETSLEKVQSAQKVITDDFQIGCHIFEDNQINIPYVRFRITAEKIYRRSKEIIRKFNPDCIYTRAYHTAPTVRRIARQNNASSVLDFRGLASEESALRLGHGLAYRFLLSRELSALAKSNRISCVSTRLKAWVADRVNRSDITVIPCCVDMNNFNRDQTTRSEVRKELGVTDNEKVICYCGGLSQWQRIDDIIELLATVSDRKENIKFLFISRQVNELKAKINQYKDLLNRCIVTSLQHSEMPRFLSAADAGIIMRDDNIVNNVASPIKIGEYLACGLPVILTDGIGDYSEQLEKAGVGLLLDDSKDGPQQVIDFMDRPDFQELSNKAVLYASENASYESHLSDYEKLFSL